MTAMGPDVVERASTDPGTRPRSREFTHSVAVVTSRPLSSGPIAPEPAPPSPTPMVITRASADPVSRIVSALIDTVLSPFAGRTPTAPVQQSAALTMLAFARREFEQAISVVSTVLAPLAGHITSGLVTGTASSVPAEADSTADDPDFIRSTHDFGLFSVTSAADPDDNHFVAFVFSSPIFTDILTSGTDPEDNVGFGAASTGIAGHTVNTIVSPLANLSFALPITDPFAELFTALVRLGF